MKKEKKQEEQVEGEEKRKRGKKKQNKQKNTTKNKQKRRRKKKMKNGRVMCDTIDPIRFFFCLFRNFDNCYDTTQQPLPLALPLGASFIGGGGASIFTRAVTISASKASMLMKSKSS